MVENKNNNWFTLMRHTFAAAIISVPVIYAFGQQNEQIKQLEDDNKSTAEKIEDVQVKVQENAVVIGKIDERTKGFEKEMNNINRSLGRILDQLQRPQQ